MYGSKMFRVAKAAVPLDPTQQEQRKALGKKLGEAKAAVPLILLSKNKGIQLVRYKMKLR
jgi:hypothetical protein